MYTNKYEWEASPWQIWTWKNIDVIVIGAGNAASNAAMGAHLEGAKVLMLESAPLDDRGGNTAFTGGALRFPYSTMEDLEPLVVDITDEERKNRRGRRL